MSQEPAKYEFTYEVKDAQSGLDFGQTESRDGDRAQGMFNVLLPDGRKQIVEYEADQDGFKPQIRYEGEANAGGYGSGGPGGDSGYPSGGPGNSGGQGGGNFGGSGGGYPSGGPASNGGFGGDSGTLQFYYNRSMNWWETEVMSDIFCRLSFRPAWRWQWRTKWRWKSGISI